MNIGDYCYFIDCQRERFTRYYCVDCNHHFCKTHVSPTEHNCVHQNNNDKNKNKKKSLSMDVIHDGIKSIEMDDIISAPD